MIDLHNFRTEIKKFLNVSIDRFQLEHDKPRSIGINSCPMAGWISTNFNLNKTLVETEYNCPDFEYAEFNLLEIPGLQDEYESDKPQFKLEHAILNYDHELGDESFNQLFFEYLKPIIREVKENFDSSFLLQILDSDCVVEI